MTTIRPPARFSIIKRSTRRGLTHQTWRKISPDAAKEIARKISEQSNENSVDDGFCGESFADKGELLSSLSPLLFSMKLFGLYFYRERRHRRHTDDPEWNSAAKHRNSSTWLRIYATIVLILVWLNAIRMFFLFRKSDHFGDILLIKMMVFSGVHLSAIMYTAHYYANHTGKLEKVFLTLPVTSNCIRAVRRNTVYLTCIVWLSGVVNLSVLAYIYFTTQGKYDFVVAPFVTYIDVPEYWIMIGRLGGYLAFLFAFPGTTLVHAINLSVVYIFWYEYKKLRKNFRLAVEKSGHFGGNLGSFRRRQSLHS